MAYDEMVSITDEFLEKKVCRVTGCVTVGGCGWVLHVTSMPLLPPQGVTKGARNKILQNISSLSQRHKTLTQMETVSTF